MEEDLIIKQRTEKQTFLRTEIIEKGFNPSSFQNYVESLKPDGSNIDNWTIEELFDIVENFKAAYHEKIDLASQEDEKIMKKEFEESFEETKESTPRNAQNLIKSMSHGELNKMKDAFKKKQEISVENKTNRIKAETCDKGGEKGIDILLIKKEKDEGQKKNLTVLEDYSAFVKIRKQQPEIKYKDLENNELILDIKQENPIKITVSDPEYKKDGFLGLGSAYVLYKIKTSPLNWEVKRKFSEFIWLRTVLNKIYPGLMIPSLSENKSGDLNTPEYFSKMLSYLSRFMNEIAASSVLISNEYTMDFLKVKDQQIFRTRKKESEYLQKAQKYIELINLEGEAHSKLSNHYKLFYNGTNLYLNNADQIYNRIKKSSKQLIKDMDKAAETLYNLADDFANLFQLTNKMNSNMNIGKNHFLSDVYASLNNMMASWGNSTIHQSHLVQEHLCNFFKFEEKQFNSYKELLKIRQTTGFEYLKYKINLDTKKEKYFLSGDITRWELEKDKSNLKKEYLLKNKSIAMNLMFPKETKIELDLRDFFGFFNYQMFDEISKGLDNKCINYVKNFVDFTNLNCALKKDLVSIWENLIVNLKPDNLMKYRESAILNRKNSKIP